MVQSCSDNAAANFPEVATDPKSVGPSKAKVKADSGLDFGAHWLKHAQTHMTDAIALAEQMLIGRHYNAMIQKADASQEGLSHPDALALGKTYVRAIDRGKHGDEIVLPQYLREEIVMDDALFQQPSTLQSAADKTERVRPGWFSGLFGRH
eukprot:TRINITY_DN66003_c0_g1_i1.p1 TRINITY_DN66003_c0_g1~~TRINITY_DN66003_c0_g1_i1.p1  ORF type:complete len:151 (-),score=26.98 TRINITY_DN66003_c0_g1_i1:123-575(-)